MGLDVAFNRQAAIDAGLVITKERRASEEQIHQEMNSGNPDPDYLDWLQDKPELVWVPGTDICTENTASDHNIILRANRWGLIYMPLTDWLMLNDITWAEF